MGRMIDALKLLDQRAPRAAQSRAVEPTAAATALEEIERPSAEEIERLAAEPEPRRLRVFGVSEVAPPSTACDDRDFGDSIPTESPAAPCKPLRWPAVPRPRQQELAALAQRVLARMTADGPRILVFASAGDATASSAIVLGLAPQLAASGDGRVLVVDADAAEAIVSRQLGAAAERSLVDVARGEVDWPELVRETDIDALDVLPARPASKAESGRLEGLDVGRALGEMGMHYALTLIDAGPASRLDAARVGRYANGVCLAVRMGQAALPAVQEAVRMLRLGKAHLLGTIAVS